MTDTTKPTDGGAGVANQWPSAPTCPACKGSCFEGGNDWRCKLANKQIAVFVERPSEEPKTVPGVVSVAEGEEEVKRHAKDRLIEATFTMLVIGYALTASRFGLFAPATLLYVAPGTWWLWRHGWFSDLPPPRLHPLHIAATIGLVLLWPLIAYAEKSLRDEVT